MPATTYEYRFRDPVFVAIWARWQAARNEWRIAREHVDFSCFTVERDSYNPDPDRIPEGLWGQHTAAAEFIAARMAYHAILKEYRDAEDT